MNILAIETSCDETAVSILSCTGGFDDPSCAVLGNALYSQAEKHAEYGGVYPSLAKREHDRNLPPLLKKVLKDSGMLNTTPTAGQKYQIANKAWEEAEQILERESDLYNRLHNQLHHSSVPNIDAIAVTVGPGLAPALWVGVNFARALAVLWDVPLVPVNHMEGHTLSVLYRDGKQISNVKSQISNGGEIEFPAVVLLISGGHTELLLMEDWFEYQLLGQTRDDAVGEAFDKVGRMLDLPYPAGARISRMAKCARNKQNKKQNNAENKLLYKDLTYKIRGALFEVRKTIGLGHKENVYHNALKEEFRNKNIAFESEKIVDIYYKRKKVGTYCPDFVVENKIIVELKALPQLGRLQYTQMWNYLKGTKYKLALLVNFGSTDLEIKRVIYDKARDGNIQRSSASLQRNSARELDITLPRPMIDSENYDFSFSGLKTAVLYRLKDFEKQNIEIDDRLRQVIARELEDAIADVIVAKTKKALAEYDPAALIVGGGVIANTHLRTQLANLAETHNTQLLLPHPDVTTDNAIMIGIAGYLRFRAGHTANPHTLSANANLTLS